MNTIPARAKLILIVSLLALIAWPASDGAAAGDLSEKEKRGKQIYLKGESDAGDMTAIMGSGDLEVPATAFTCANCHGVKGEGTSEGGLVPPPITWSALTQPSKSPLTNRQRPAYNEATLARSIFKAIDSAGGRFHPGMPYYKMTEGQMADLIAYLKVIGTAAEAEPGLGEDSIKVGAALPLSGPLATVGVDVKAALEAYFKEINSQGGVYNRKFELAVEDSKGDSQGTEEATRRLLERHGVFAFVASFEPAGSASSNELLKKNEVPLVGPVTLSPRLPRVPNRFVFYLLPSFGHQSRALIDFIQGKAAGSVSPGAPRLGVIYSDNEFDQDALEGLKMQAGIHSLEILAEHSYPKEGFSAEAAAQLMASKKTDYIFFFGKSADFVAFAKELDRRKLSAKLVSSTVMVGQGAFLIPASVAERTYLAYPASMSTGEEMKEFLEVMQKSGVELRSPGFQAVAFAAAKVLVEATKRSSRQINRIALVNSLEQLRNFNTGVLPPVSFGPNRRVGAAGSYVVGVDIVKREYIRFSERIIPKD
jgi:ABC-type branched-subunit amino acid transport system substrate-binding protein